MKAEISDFWRIPKKVGLCSCIVVNGLGIFWKKDQKKGRKEVDLFWEKCRLRLASRNKAEAERDRKAGRPTPRGVNERPVFLSPRRCSFYNTWLGADASCLV